MAAPRRLASPTGIVNSAVGGSKHIKVRRNAERFITPPSGIACREITDELPPDPPVTRETEKGPWSISGAMQSNPQMPVSSTGCSCTTPGRRQGQPGQRIETDAAAERQLREVHAADRPVHGGSRLQQDGGYTLPSRCVRRHQDHRRSRQARSTKAESRDSSQVTTSQNATASQSAHGWSAEALRAGLNSLLLHFDLRRHIRGAAHCV